MMLLAGTAAAQELSSVAPQILSTADAALYRESIAAARAGQITKSRSLFAKVSDNSLQGYVEAEQFLSPKARLATPAALAAWLKDYRELAVADRIYRLAV